MGCKGAVVKLKDGTYGPCKTPNKSTPIDDEKYIDIS